MGYSQTPPAYHDDDDGMPGIIGFVDLIIGILSIGIIACIFGAIYNSLRKKSEDYADTTRRMSQANINTITDSSDGVGSANNMGMGLGFNGSSNINISGGESGSINGDGNKASAISSSVVSNYPAASPPCPVLPQGWERIYDDSTGRYYFWHEESETSQWEPPVAYVQ